MPVGQFRLSQFPVCTLKSGFGRRNEASGAAPSQRATGTGSRKAKFEGVKPLKTRKLGDLPKVGYNDQGFAVAILYVFLYVLM